MQQCNVLRWFLRGKYSQRNKEKSFFFLLSNPYSLFFNSASNLRKPLGRWSAVRPMINARLAPINKNASDSICFDLKKNCTFVRKNRFMDSFFIVNFWRRRQMIFGGGNLDFWEYFGFLGTLLDFGGKFWIFGKGASAGLKGSKPAWRAKRYK